jgi:hypothetical protein
VTARLTVAERVARLRALTESEAMALLVWLDATAPRAVDKALEYQAAALPEASPAEPRPQAEAAAVAAEPCADCGDAVVLIGENFYHAEVRIRNHEAVLDPAQAEALARAARDPSGREVMCGTRHDGWACTLLDGHDGDHKAYEWSGQPIATWPQASRSLRFRPRPSAAPAPDGGPPGAVASLADARAGRQAGTR